MKKFLSGRFAIVAELLDFILQERLWWMTPFIVVLVLTGALILLGQSSPIAPFLYAAF